MGSREEREEALLDAAWEGRVERALMLIEQGVRFECVDKVRDKTDRRSLTLSDTLSINHFIERRVRSVHCFSRHRMHVSRRSTKTPL